MKTPTPLTKAIFFTAGCWLLNAAGLYAQLQFPRLALQPGDTTAAYQEIVKVYQKPSGTSSTVGTLAKGQTVVIRHRENVVAEFDGYRQYWYQVGYGKRHEKTGYVFGAFLASACAITPDGAKFLLHFIVSDSTYTEPVLLEIAVVRKDEPLLTFSEKFQLKTSDSLTIRVGSNRGFPNYKSLIIFDFQDTTCPEYHREIGVLWNGEIARSLPVAEMPKGRDCFSCVYVFPNDPDGTPGQVKLKTRKGRGAVKMERFREIKDFGLIPVTD
jgi:hypothetical protein